MEAVVPGEIFRWSRIIITNCGDRGTKWTDTSEVEYAKSEIARLVFEHHADSITDLKVSPPTKWGQQLCLLLRHARELANEQQVLCTCGALHSGAEHYACALSTVHRGPFPDYIFFALIINLFTVTKGDFDEATGAGYGDVVGRRSEARCCKAWGKGKEATQSPGCGKTGVSSPGAP
ncbi:hypothetical protein HispidOSU_030790 [Sigmodon hispidus]